MTVASGQMPYEYEGVVPIRAGPNSWPGGGNGLLGISGILLEQGMFVLNAEIRKWDRTPGYDLEDTHKVYTHPDLPGSGFEPKADGSTLGGLVGLPAIIEVTNIAAMRDLINDNNGLLDLYSDDSDYTKLGFREAWYTSAYPESTSGYLRVVQAGPFIISLGAINLRPDLTSVTGGDDIVTTDLHWLGGSGVIFDIDVGEVVFQPFPFLGESNFFTAAQDNIKFDFGPMIPVLQTTTGGIPTLTGREQSDLANVSFKQLTNFDALGSGKMQFDGYALLSQTRFRLVTGNDTNFFGSLGGTSDFSSFIPGLRQVNNPNGFNDASARVYLTPGVKGSGLYRTLVDTPQSTPFISIPSGLPVSLWPQGDIRLNQTNRIYSQAPETASDGTLIVEPRNARGLHVLDDALWIAGPNAALSGTFDSRGLTVISPYNGRAIWYRPAERTLATSGSRPVGSTDPGHFGVHVGLESFGASEFIRISRVWSEFRTIDAGEDDVLSTFHFQRYNKTSLTHTETSVGVYQKNDSGGIGNRIDDMMFDGTHYWLNWEFGRLMRFDTSLVFAGGFVAGDVARRRHYANGKRLYTIGGNIGGSDPLLSMTPPGGAASGIGEWSFTPPGDIVNDIGTVTHDSAKRLRAETHVGYQFTARIHDIINVSGSTHVADGVWMLIQFGTTLYLMRIEETASEWEVKESIEILHTADAIPGGGVPSDFPYEIVLHDID